MNILFIVSQFPSLSESFIVAQIVDLLEAGHRVHIVSWKASDQEEVHHEVLRYDLLNKMTIMTFPSRKWKLRLYGMGDMLACLLRSPQAVVRLMGEFVKKRSFSYQDLRLLRIALRERCEVVHAHFGPNGVRSLCLKKAIRNMTHLTTFHGYDVTVSIQRHGVDIYSELFERGDVFTYNSDSTRKKLLGLGCPEWRMKKLPMGIDCRNIVFRERTLEPGQTVRLLSVGRLVEMKGREYAIKAVSSLADKYPIQYDIVGDGPLRDELQSQIDDLQATAYITLWGWVSSERLSEFYRDAHLFVHPSVTSLDGNQEGQGVVLLEAQAHGIPVVATVHSAFPESVVDGKTGFLVAEKNVDQLAERIGFLIQNSDCWAEMGRNGRDFALTSFDRKELCERLVDYYSDI